MTCEGCGREVTLMDGHFCGQCSGQIAASVTSALADVSVVDVDLEDVFVGKDGLLYIRADYEGGADGQ